MIEFTVHEKLAMAVFLALALVASAQDAAPWCFGRSADAAQSALLRVDREEASDRASTAGQTCALWLTFYQKHLTPVMRSKCVMIPSCSAYSREAIRKHGVLRGIVMSADRLLHEGCEHQTSEAVRKGARIFFLDKLEHNDFWWTKGMR